MAQIKAIATYDAELDHLSYWIEPFMAYLEQGGAGELKKTRRLLERFVAFIRDRYDGSDQISILVPRDIKAYLDWLQAKKEDGGCNYAPSYVNGHQVALGQFLEWLAIRSPQLLKSNPSKGVQMVRAVAEPEAKALTPRQIVSLKNIADRLPTLHCRKNARPYRDRAIVYVLLSTGLRRHELVLLDLAQLVPHDVEDLKKARRVKIVRVRGKRKTERTVFISAEARWALVEYLEKERPLDSVAGTRALFLSASGKGEKRLHVRSLNKILDPIGRWHDAAFPDPERQIAPLSPHDLRHTCASELRRNNPEMTDQDLMIYMGWSDKEQLLRYTKAQEELMSGFVEQASQSM
ncbi:tyrosine-type recombinase/integrase [Cohnella sp. GCM10020058]|uniref:tyrosine-type recombinase/integrase n=1 Tax=Cohnella sp. GCM10020058 TaxID=3317330 RepID=UPI0036279CDC